MKSHAIDIRKPGGGLPFPENYFLRHIYAPLYFLFTSEKKATKNFQIYADKIIQIYLKFPEDKHTTTISINRIMGIEYSSTSWSADMLLEHLVIVGETMLLVLKELTSGKWPRFKVSTATVKPSGCMEFPLHRFQEFVEKYLYNISNLDLSKSEKKFLHPWFGELTAVKWHKVSSLHLAVHLKQLRLMKESLD